MHSKKKVENGWPAHVVRIVKDEKCVNNCNRKTRIEKFTLETKFRRGD